MAGECAFPSLVAQHGRGTAFHSTKRKLVNSTEDTKDFILEKLFTTSRCICPNGMNFKVEGCKYFSTFSIAVNFTPFRDIPW